MILQTEGAKPQNGIRSHPEVLRSIVTDILIKIDMPENISIGQLEGTIPVFVRLRCAVIIQVLDMHQRNLNVLSLSVIKTGLFNY
jgi:hypothetical protein